MADSTTKRNVWLSLLPTIAILLTLIASMKSNHDLSEENASLTRDLQETVKVAKEAVTLAKSCAEKSKP